MTAELATLERKLDSATATLNAKFDLVLSRLDEIRRTGKPGVSQREFAKLIGVTPRTVVRWVKAKKIRLEKGRVPHSEAKKFFS